MRFILPGMGATSAMYAGPWRGIEDARFPDWPPIPDPITLERTAAQVISENGIQPSDVLVGSSLGGVVALEIAQRLGSREVVLVGSARERAEINPFLRALAPFPDLTPFRLLQAMAGRSAGPLGAMFAQVDPRFIRAMCKELAGWPGYQGRGTRIRRIHGEHDRVIRCPPDACRVPGGGHLIAMTHAEACAGFVLSTKGVFPAVD
jgi:pimeloyl-ACP methyl ester carboxylesterase